MVDPWKQNKRRGNSFFLWSLCYGLIALLVFAAIAGLGVLIALPAIQQGAFGPSAMAGIAIGGVLFIIALVAAGYIDLFLVGFVVPVMYRYDLKAMKAWSHFIPLLKANLGKFLLFGLVNLGLGIVVAMISSMVVLLTCCIAGLPYLNAVFFLPVTVFFRSFSLEFLGQFSPEYDVFQWSLYDAQ